MTEPFSAVSSWCYYYIFSVIFITVFDFNSIYFFTIIIFFCYYCFYLCFKQHCNFPF